MSSGNDTLTGAVIKIMIDEAYANFVYNLVVMSIIALLLYVAVLQLPQEIENIWSRRFSFPSLLYVLAKYPVIITQMLYFVINVLPLSTPEQICNIIYNVASSLSILSFIGVQGLLVARAYALCQGGKIVAVALGSSFFVGVLFLLLEVILFDTCTFTPSVPTSERVIDLLGNVSSIVVDLLSFSLCLYKVWDTWRSKRGLHMQGGNNLVSILIKQIISRFCFTILISVTYAIIGQFLSNIIITASLSSVHSGFSAILITDFTLDLRESNSAAIETNDASLPSILSVQDMLQHIHQTFIVELNDRDDMHDDDESSDVHDEDFRRHIAAV